MGSTRKRGATWTYILDIGRDPKTGKRKQKTRGGFPTKKAAEAAMAAELTERRRGTYLEPSTEPLGAYLDRWLDATTHGRSPSSTHGYRKALKRLPQSLVLAPLASLSALTIQEAYAPLLARYAATTLVQTHTILKMALAQAVRWRLLTTNPCDGVRLPAPRAQPETAAVWSAEEQRRFLGKTAEDPLHPLWRFLLDSGCRIGEARALRWADLDFDTGMVRIARTMTKDADGRVAIGADTKTRASRRTIPLAPETVDVLERHRLDQLAYRRDLGAYWRDEDIVFAGHDGGVIAHSTLCLHLAAACERAGVPRLTPHGLRKTMTTLWARAGVNPAVIARRLGHSSVTMTLAVYTQVTDDWQQSALDQVIDFLTVSGGDVNIALSEAAETHGAVREEPPSEY